MKHTIGVKWIDQGKSYGFFIELPDWIPAHCEVIHRRPTEPLNPLLLEKLELKEDGESFLAVELGNCAFTTKKFIEE